MATPLSADEVSSLLRRLGRGERRAVIEAARRSGRGVGDARLRALALAHAGAHRRRLRWLVAVYALLSASVTTRLLRGGIEPGALGALDLALAVLVPLLLAGTTVLLVLHRRAPAPTEADLVLLRAWLRERTDR